MKIGRAIKVESLTKLPLQMRYQLCEWKGGTASFLERDDITLNRF